jgi:5-methylcytosine-specific restriction endonuclease McrA
VRARNRINPDKASHGANMRPTLREAVFARYGNTCQICFTAMDPDDFEWRDGVFIQGKRYPNIDHIVPRRLGGKDRMDNLRVAHMICNVLGAPDQLLAPPV